MSLRGGERATPAGGQSAGGIAAEDRVHFAGLAEGDAAAFAALFRRYYDALCVFAEGYVRSPDDAEEVVEEVFVRLWERREHLDVRVSVKAYLYSATKNQALNHLRRAATEERWVERVSRSGDVPGLGQPAPDIVEALYATDLARAVDEAIPQLSERCRQVFLLHRRHGLTYAEIAEALGISPKTVENHLGRALKELRSLLARFLAD